MYIFMYQCVRDSEHVCRYNKQVVGREYVCQRRCLYHHPTYCVYIPGSVSLRHISLSQRHIYPTSLSQCVLTAPRRRQLQPSLVGRQPARSNTTPLPTTTLTFTTTAERRPSLRLTSPPLASVYSASYLYRKLTHLLTRLTLCDSKRAHAHTNRRTYRNHLGDWTIG